MNTTKTLKGHLEPQGSRSKKHNGARGKKKDVQDERDYESVTDFVKINQRDIIRWLDCNGYPIDTINLQDAAIIEYVARWCRNDKAIYHHDDDTFVWIDLATMLRRLPLLGIRQRQLYNRIEKLCDIGILKRKRCYNQNNGHTQVFLKSTLPTNKH